MITTVICLQDTRLRECMETYIRQNPDFHVIEQTDKGNVAIKATVGIVPDLVICEDVPLASAKTFLEECARYVPNTYFLVCNVRQDPDTLLELLRAGMNDALTEDWTEDSLWNALDRFRARYQALRESGPLQTERSLRKVLDKKFFEDTIITKTGFDLLRDQRMLEQEYQISFIPGQFQALFLQIDPRPREELRMEAFLPLLQVEDLTRSFFGAVCENVICYLQEDSLSVILNSGEALPEMRLLCRKFLSECSREFFWLSGANTLTVGVGLGCRSAELLPLEIQSAKFATWMRLSAGKGRVLEYASYESHHRDKSEYLDDLAKQELEIAVQLRDRNRCVETVRESLNTAENSGVYISRALCINDVLIHAFNQAGLTSVVHHEKYTWQSMNTPPVIEGMADLREIPAALTTWIDRCFSMLEEPVPADKRDIQSAKRFIAAHLAEDLKLRDIAAHVNLSPSYLCSKFKQETGQTVVEYLTEVRLEQAKLLLRNSDLRIGEIAEQVGFHDARHFSRTFRQQTGLLPTEFRQTIPC